MNARDLHFMPQPRRPGRDVTVATLSINALYQAPSGRMCTLLPRTRETPPEFDTFNFVYTDSTRSQDPLDRDGFRLTAANVGILREVMR
jgi:hypothetical protein